ncbi:hypothetical protein ACFX13_044166 [Malus domestica]
MEARGKGITPAHLEATIAETASVEMMIPVTLEALGGRARTTYELHAEETCSSPRQKLLQAKGKTSQKIEIYLS